MKIPINLDDILPTLNKGLSNIGFLLGAGTSYEAGYPLSVGLTTKVMSQLNDAEIEILEEMLNNEDLDYNFEDGIPDIEVLSDLIYKYSLADNEPKYRNIEKSIREKIVQIIKSIQAPNLDLHCRFLNSLKKLIGIRSETVFIFTTNYDLLFERAASNSRIPVSNGFLGIIFRYFDIESLSLKFGKIERLRNFREIKEPRIKLLKLHGSVSWYKDKHEVFETGNYDSIQHNNCSIIIPRRQKLRETLEYPYDSIFRYTSRIIGSSQCKYLVSCGYSFRDEHINDYLILPKLRENRIKFFALFKEEPKNIEKFKVFPNFNYLTKDVLYLNGTKYDEELDVWKFSNFVNMLANKAGC